MPDGSLEPGELECPRCGVVVRGAELRETQDGEVCRDCFDGIDCGGGYGDGFDEGCDEGYRQGLDDAGGRASATEVSNGFKMRLA